MNDNRYISLFHGMELEPIAEPNRRHNENGVLHLVKYYTLKDIIGTLNDQDIHTFQQVVENITVYDSNGNKIKGLYNRGAGEHNKLNKNSIRKISHDNLKAISAFSRLLEDRGLSYHKDIANHGLKWQMRFDNAYPDAPRWIYKKSHVDKYGTSLQWHPRDWFIFLHNGNKTKWWNLIHWFCGIIFIIANILTCFNNETSGKLLMFITLENGSKHSWLMGVTKKVCYWLLKKKYGPYWLSVIMGIYHHQDENHPLNTNSKNLEL